jgi:site-specific DNA-methyltransferase (adenine-specific)
MREYIPDESIDLVYLDPPFNSNRSYNVLFKDESGREAEAQIEAFEDTRHWGEAAEQTYYSLVVPMPNATRFPGFALHVIEARGTTSRTLVSVAK